MLFSEALLAQGKIVDCTLNNLSFQHCACETDFSWQPQLLIRNYITAGAGKHNHLMTHTGVFGNDYYNSSSAVRLHDNCHDMHPSWQDWNYYIQTKIIQSISMLVGLHRSFSSGPIDCCKTHLNTSDGSASSPVSFPHTTHTGLGARLRAQQRHVYTHILTLFPISLNICVLFWSSEVVASKHSADKWTWWLVTPRHQDTDCEAQRNWWWLYHEFCQTNLSGMGNCCEMIYGCKWLTITHCIGKEYRCVTSFRSW